MGWLTDTTNWLVRQIQQVFEAVTTFALDMVIHVVETQLSLVLLVANAIPVPDFVTEYAIGSLLSNLSSDLVWVLGKIRLAEALGLLGLGYVARLLRKLLTLGQW